MRLQGIWLTLYCPLGGGGGVYNYLKDKVILDISGGPGYLAKHLEKFCQKIVVTELTEKSVKGMSDYLKIEVIKYSYNEDKIDFLFKKNTFDIVINNFSINYCVNLDDYTKRLYNIISNNGFVYVSSVAPTFGMILRNQFDEYSYIVNYHPEILKRIFIQNGFKLIHSYTDDSYHYIWGGIKRSFIPALPFHIMYKLFAFKRKNNINRQLDQKNIIYIFKKEVRNEI